MFHWIQLWWHTTNLRAVILFSLLLQTFLFFSAPLRKRTTNSLVTIPIWLAYNLADATAIFGVGLISKPCGNALGAYANQELVAFWAPFLLLHLGGPDTITAFALEDNELWLRHLLQLVVQLATSAYVFILTLSSNNQLWLPTLLMFISALIKSIERTRSLYLASWRRFRDSMIREPDPGPNYHKLMDEYLSNQESGLPLRPEFVEAPNPEARVGDNNTLMPDTDDAVDPGSVYVLHFETVKGLIADLKFSFPKREWSRLFFLKLTPKQAFESVKIELNFLYDILFTKTPVLVRFFGLPSISRFVSSVSCFAAFLLFHSMDPKHKFFHKIDIQITYTLLLSTIVHDIIAFFVIGISDWSTEEMVNLDLFDHEPKFCILIRLCLIPLSTICITIGFNMKIILLKLIPIMERRWAGCISQYNLIFYCLHPRSKKWDKLIGNLGLTNILDGRKYVTTKRFNDVLRDFIFDELKIKSTEAVAIETAKEFCSTKGDWVLKREGGCDNLLPYTLHADYDKILILWHIATVVSPSTIKGDTSKTVFFDACILAKELKKLDKDKWKILSKVWVELLSFAACRSNANSHATHLSKGGQLISLVWLLMFHLGLGDWFEVSEGHQTAHLSPDENHQQPDERDEDLV